VLKHRLSATRAVPVPGLKAFDHWLQGQVLAEQWEPSSDDKALASFVEAVRLDPDFARGHASIAAILNTRNNLRPGSPTRLADQRRAMASVRRALELDPDDGRNHLDMAWSAMLQRDYDTAELHFGTAQSHSPYDANVAISAGQGFAYLGQHELGISLARKAFWLSPVHPPYYSTYLATIYFVAGRYEECLATAHKVADLFPEIPAWQAAAAQALGEPRRLRRSRHDRLAVADHHAARGGRRGPAAPWAGAGGDRRGAWNPGTSTRTTTGNALAGVSGTSIASTPRRRRIFRAKATGSSSGRDESRGGGCGVAEIARAHSSAKRRSRNGRLPHAR
jgi:adenylate cyclase